VQLPHGYVEGSDLVPHVHWTPTDSGSGNVVWGLEYTWANVDGTFGNSTVVTVPNTADGTAYKHQVAEFSAISGSGKKIRSLLLCRLFRKAADAADTYAADVALLDVGFQYQADTLGSREARYK
jgi:hypothetical protein